MTQKIALITGANRGLGLEIARQLGQQGMLVLVGARTQEKADQAAEILVNEGLKARGLQLDVTSPSHISTVKNLIFHEYGRLDVLVNNAGVFIYEGDIFEKFQKTFEANTFGPFHLIDSLLPLLKESPAGRIVNQSSILGSLGAVQSNELAAQMAEPYYSSSKAAMNMFTVILANRLKDTNIKINSSHPGWAKTDMGGPNAQLEIEEGARTAVKLATLPDDGPSGQFFHFDQVLPW